MNPPVQRYGDGDGCQLAPHTSRGLEHLPHTFTASKNIHIFLKEDSKQTHGSVSNSSLSESESL